MADYCTRSDIERIFGAANVTRWADLDSNGDTQAIAERISGAISAASAEVDSILAGSPIRVPLATVPVLIREVTASLAGVLLYEGRGTQGVSVEGGQVVHPYIFKRQWAVSVLEELKAGRRRLVNVT